MRGVTSGCRVAALLIPILTFGLLAPAYTEAQVDDHLKCYKIKDPVKLKGIVDLTSEQFGLEEGCKISKAKMFCVPTAKTVVEAEDKATGGPIDLLPISGPDPGDRVCYKIKCPDPQPPDTEVSDQFGNRTLTKFKAFMLCTPAVKGAPPTTTTTTTSSTTTTTFPPVGPDAVGCMCGSIIPPNTIFETCREMQDCDGLLRDAVCDSLCADYGGTALAVCDMDSGQCPIPCDSDSPGQCQSSCPGFETCTEIYGACLCME